MFMIPILLVWSPEVAIGTSCFLIRLSASPRWQRYICACVRVCVCVRESEWVRQLQTSNFLMTLLVSLTIGFPLNCGLFAFLTLTNIFVVVHTSVLQCQFRNLDKYCVCVCVCEYGVCPWWLMLWWWRCVCVCVCVWCEWVVIRILMMVCVCVCVCGD